MQERAWYDNHRSSLEPEPDIDAMFEDIRRGTTSGRRKMHDPGLQVNHIIRFMDFTIWDTMDDGENVSHREKHSPSSVDLAAYSDLLFDGSLQGFFTIYRHLFTRLASEERNFTDDAVDYPSFGLASWPWSPAEKNAAEGAKYFYSTWTNFSTAKDFVWVEYWNLAEAPDRRVRRCEALFQVRAPHPSDLATILTGRWKERTRRSGTTLAESTTMSFAYVGQFPTV